MKKATPHITQNEALIFESSQAGRKGYDFPALDVSAPDLTEALGSENIRDEVVGFPEVSEPQVVRHFTRLSTWNYSVDSGMYPLGSCTMKYNPKINERVVRFEGLAQAHPYLPAAFAQGCLEILKKTADYLAEITGMDVVTLQPPAGASGELTGVLLVRAYLEHRGNPRKKILIPDSAHGTNPASAAIAGYVVESLKSDAHGCLSLEVLDQAMNEEVAALMLTNPNTLGLFENQIGQITELVHARGGLVYMDGANLNALMGIARPGDFGIDVMHLNLHKTFSTPHGGGGPGSGPVAAKEFLAPFLPTPVVVEDLEGKYGLDYNRPLSIGKIKAFFGNFGTVVRALAFILANGADGLKEASLTAILNANYLKHRLRSSYDLPFDGPILHEVVFSNKRQARQHISVMDIAKRLIDYGFHPPTVAFPLIVPGALMIEPTESESREELDLFVEAMQTIAKEAETNPDLLLQAPHFTKVRRLDEVQAARKPVLRWKP
jgi:glycine dehydrogenase subunit 2